MKQTKLRAQKANNFTTLMNKEWFPGVLLFITAVISLIIMNSPLAEGFRAFKGIYIGVEPIKLNIAHWIADGLMAIFFLYVSLELKRELIAGVLSKPANAALPTAAAMGGIIVPVLFYLGFTWGTEYVDGWAIASATDIAFSLGVLSLFGDRVPNMLKAFLLALAIVDDLAAVLIVAIGYTDDIAIQFLGYAVGIFVTMMMLNRMGVRRLEVYWLLGILLWAVLLQTGIHPTVGGVLTAIAIPFDKGTKAHDASEPLIVAEHALRPLVLYFIMPAYALFKAGFPIETLAGDALNPPLLGVLFGLVLGKPIGILLGCYAFCWAFKQPLTLGFYKVLGVSFLAGIGFTMSLFIGDLAFPLGYYASDQVKMGILIGSVIAGVIGAFILGKALPKYGHTHVTSPTRPFLAKDDAGQKS